MSSGDFEKHIVAQMKEIMEVTEVLPLQFVIPVAAVVVCALLVFVFGFKNVPEPTYEYDSSEDRKKKGRTKKKEKTVPSNGHIVNVEQVKVSSKPQQSVENIPEKKVVTPRSKPKKPAKDVTVQKRDVSMQGAKSEDGWTTAVSRKDKKKKKIGMEESVVSYDESPVAEESAQQVIVTQDPPLEQRGKKAKGKAAKSTVDVQKEVPETSEALAEETVVKEEPQCTQQVVEEKTLALDTAGSVVIAEEKPQTPSKKKKSKKKKEVTETQTTDTAEVLKTKTGAQTGQEKGDMITVEDTNSIEKQLAEAMQENAMASAEQAKQKISPKRPSKKKSKEGSGKVSSTSQPDTSHSATDKPKETVASTEVPDIPTQPKPVSNPAEATPDTRDAQSAGPVSFDEIGEWQEAKPVKKRKKPRRDN